MSRTILLPLLMFLSISTVLAQEQVTEEEVNREKLFIEANREKLLGNYDKAVSMLRELYRQDGDNAAVAYELGRLLHAQGDIEDAVRYLKSATNLAPDNEWYLKFLADIYQQEGRNAEGAALYESLAKKSPDDQYTYFRWAYFLVKAQEVDKAIKVYDDLEKAIGFNEEIARRRHTLFLGLGDTKRAGKELERLVEAYPNVLEYKHILAAFYDTQGDKAAARKVYERIIAQNPKDAKAQLALAGGSNVQQDELRYLAELRPAFERSDVEVDLKIGKLYPFITMVSETGNKVIADAALELTTIMESVHSSDAKPFSAAGDLLYHSGRRKEAIVKYRATLERDENVFPVWEQLLTALYEIGDGLGLYEAANDALDIFPNRAVIQYYLALGADATKRYDEALDATNMATMMSGRDQALRGEIQALEGQVYSHKGDKAAAAAAFKQALELAPASSDVNYRYAEYLLEKNDLKNAKAAAERAANQMPYHPYYTNGLAKVYYQDGRYEAAEEWNTKALTNGAAYWPAALELAGDIQFQLKHTEQAVSFWQQAKALGGDSKRLEDKIAKRSL